MVLDGLGLCAALLSLTATAALAAWSWSGRRRDQEALRQARRDAERNLKEAVELFEATYRALSRDLQDLRQEIDERAAPAVVHTAAAAGADRRFQALALAGRGMNADEIAGRVGLPSGEVELILRLERLRKRAEGRTKG